MLHPSIVWMVFGVWTLGVKSQVIVQSPNISTFGTWQPWARCPEGQYANGMRIKFEEWSEDVEIAGLTAVDLRCAAKGEDSLVKHRLKFCTLAVKTEFCRYTMFFESKYLG